MRTRTVYSTIYSFCILFFIFSGQAWAQLKCTSCTVTPTGGTAIVGTSTSQATIPVDENKTFAGTIQLDGDCEFIITGTGDYTLSGQITSAVGSTSLTFKAPDAGSGGNAAGITLSGAAANTYSGLTTIAGGYVICNKTNGAATVVAIPNDLKMAPASANYIHLWYKANGQMGSTSVVEFSDAPTRSFLHLNGTTQTIAGIKGNNEKVIVEHWQSDYLPASMSTAEPDRGGILNIATGSTSCTFGGGAAIFKGRCTQSLTVNVIGGTQIIQNPTSDIQDVTFTSAEGATLEFNTTTAATYSLGSGVTFKGNGTLKKTGSGVLVMTGSSVLKSGGDIWVAEGTLRNGRIDNNTTLYSKDTESNTAVLRVEAATGHTAIFDLYGYNSLFGGLKGNAAGIVQNNYGSAGTSPGGGRNELLLKLIGDYTFDGVIRDNSGSQVTPVSDGKEGKGGIVLKKEGNGTQVLTGVNRYSGTTVISSGRLKLEGKAQLFGWNYTGVLEIANVADAASQAVFEHNGTEILGFSGNITNPGEGAVKGIFLQSGSGKSIIMNNPDKDFTGQVKITNGFLGGGKLGKTNTVNLEGTGSIGGGDGAEGYSGTLTIGGLTFKSETAKLRVTSASRDNAPSLLDVKSKPTSATGVTRFVVDVLGGANLQSGRILKIPDGSSLNGLPTPVIGDNNTGKGVRFEWKNDGLWMQISQGTLALSVSSVCPKRIDAAGNSPITVTATYSNAQDFPPAGTTPVFRLSNNEAKSGDIKIERNETAHTITATFNGANSTNADLPYTITYDDRQYAQSIATRINRMPVLSVSSGAVNNTTCLGLPLVLQGACSRAGTGTISISSQNTSFATVGSMTDALTAPVTTRAVGSASFLLTDKDGCKSEVLTVEVKEALTITVENATLCAMVGGAANSTTLSADHDAAEASAWAIAPATGASISDVTQDRKGARFHVSTTDITEQKQFIVEYTDKIGCKKTTTITVNPNPILTPVSPALCATVNGTATLINASQDPASVSAAWAIISPATGAGASIDNVTEGGKRARFNVTTTDLTEQKPFTVEYSGQAGCKGRTVITVNPVPVITVSPATATICTGEQTAIRLSTNVIEAEKNRVTYSWEVTTNNLGAQPSGTDNQASFNQQRLINSGTAASSVTYTFTPWYIVDAAVRCAGQAGQSVYTVGPHVEVGISSTTPEKVCLGDNKITVTATAPEGYTYQWLQDGNPIPDAAGQSFDVLTNKVSASVYAVKITKGTGGCAVSDSKRVEVTEDAYFTNANATATVVGKTEVEINKPVSFKYNGPDAVCSWNFGDNTPVATEKETSHIYPNSGTYKPTLLVVKPNQAVCKKTFTLELKITPITGDLNGSGVLSVYPVPAQDRLTIVNDDGGDLQNITIYDLGGKPVMSEAVNGSKATVSIAHFANGIYLLTVTGSKGVKRMKISKN